MAKELKGQQQAVTSETNTHIELERVAWLTDVQARDKFRHICLLQVSLGLGQNVLDAWSQ
jgi:hypothetical protein